MPFLTLPLALLGALSLPVLASIYWLRSRQRRQVVSSLMLWAAKREAREGGRRWQRWQTPLLFLLELLALLLLTGAATDPRMPWRQTVRPVAVVLDDSYSMRAEANGGASALDRGRAQIEQALGEAPGFRAKFILAGDQPRVLGEAVQRMRAARQRLEQWRGSSAAAKLDRAITLARQTIGPRGRILVVTDSAPPAEKVTGRLRWRAVGRAAPNLAFVNAARGGAGDRRTPARVVLEIANLADGRRTMTLSLPGGGRRLTLAGGETRRVRLTLNKPAQVFTASLSGDALDIDNQLVLYPPIHETIRLRLAVHNDSLREHLARAIDATGQARRVQRRAHLRLIDRPAATQPSAPGTPGAPATPATPGTAGAAPPETTGDNSAAPPAQNDDLSPIAWTVRFHTPDDSDQGNESEPYVGPFVIDRTHPLTEGLSLEGVVWAAAKNRDLPGRPVLSAGNIVLLADAAMPAGRLISVNLDPAHSTLQQTPNLPVLMWNLMRMRREALPGLETVNARLGRSVRLTAPTTTGRMTHTRPGGSKRTRPIPAGGRITLPADRVGSHRVEAGPIRERFAVNALSRGESDLREAAAGEWGRWRDREVIQNEYASMRWLLLLPVLGLLVLHGYLLAGGKGGG